MTQESAMAMIGWRLSSLLGGAIEPTEDGDFQFEAGCADIVVSVDSIDGLDMLVMAARVGPSGLRRVPERRAFWSAE